MILNLDLSTDSAVLWGNLSKIIEEYKFDFKKIEKAYVLAKNAHKNQFRDSGEEYITHPLWVAMVVAQLDIGQEAIVASLLHDCIEDTKITENEISKMFGDEIALLVTGLTEVKKKTSGIEVHQTNIDVFRRFLFSSVNDVRILIIRLVDKLHNGLTIDSLSKERQIKYAKRVMGIYGPVAEYVGLHYFKKKIEDIAFEILNPKEVNKLKKIFSQHERNEIKALNLIKTEIESAVEANRFKNIEIEGRIKSLYSTYLKARKKGLSDIKDRVGIRVLTNSIGDCYQILGLLHARYQYLPDEFDDYISTPKANGYRSIQTTIKWKEGVTVEIQIRTKEMHEFNEFGPASHIAYKLSTDASKDGVGYEWVKELINWQKSSQNINNYRINVLSKYVYVFTPRGDTIQMPAGSTALDFAYRIHSDIGDRCVGVKKNGVIAKISDEIETGDMVEILVGKKINANKNWLSVVKTPEARERIRRVLSEKLGIDDID
jgi:guanosine-3',5'-bis(diphosphate) 3'-pyrophosphohydrolase